jgi:5-methylcytosine-specific restriction endonuclease McrA
MRDVHHKPCVMCKQRSPPAHVVHRLCTEVATHGASNARHMSCATGEPHWNGVAMPCAGVQGSARHPGGEPQPAIPMIRVQPLEKFSPPNATRMKLSGWARHKDDPEWRERKRAQMRERAAQKYREDHPHLLGVPVSRKNRSLCPAIVARRSAREVERAVAAMAREAARARWHDFQIVHCKRCHLPFLRTELQRATHRCRGCRKAIALEKRLKDPEKWRLLRRARKHRRRAQKAGAGGSCSPAQWRSILARCKGLCQRCGSPGEMTRDHIIPLSRGGSDDWTNIQPLCHGCNSIKCNAVTGFVQAFIPGMISTITCAPTASAVCASRAQSPRPTAPSSPWR